MRHKRLISLGIAGIILGSTHIASAASYVINFSGNLNEFNRPDSLSGLDAFALGAQGAYSGRITLDNVERFTTFLGDANPDPDIFEPFPGLFENTSGSITFDGMDGGSFVVTNEILGGFEGERVFVPNPDFDPSLPPCSGFEISRGDNGCGEPGVVENSPYLVTVSPTGEELRGDAILEIVDGLPDTFNYIGDRNSLESFDIVTNVLEQQNEEIESFFQLEAVSLMLGDFAFTGSDGDTYFFDAGETFASLTVSEPTPVPVPAAVWLFGSAFAGLVGLSRKKSNKS
ncbi:MAG: VPLPA-CTERM sorting domain-containing protein [Pseudomonadota bacterium]